ncbi:MAG TPA: hypothetical protein VF550_00725 [Polyangia bacterium]
MRQTCKAADEKAALVDDDLKAIQLQLVTLAQATRDYPLECSLGTYELLFESRDDIEILIESLTEEISEARNAA